MVYHSPCDSCHRQQSREEKRHVPATLIYRDGHSQAMYQAGKDLALSRGNLASETSPAHPSTTMASQDPAFAASAHQHSQQFYGQYNHQPSMPCTHGQCPPGNKSWPSSYSHVHPPGWHPEAPIRHFESPNSHLGYGSHYKDAASLNYVNMPANEEYMPFEPYFPSDQAPCLGELTPEHSPLAVSSSTVTDEHEYSSSPPPKAESPPSAPSGDEHTALVQRVLVSSSPVMRSDGLRKRNAKFEIPKHRTIDTIDHLINKEKDEKLVKELKAQKRLLKNREAALQSRQRKKHRAEELEKQVMSLRAQLEASNAAHKEKLIGLQNDVVTLTQHNSQLTSENARISQEFEKTLAARNDEVIQLRRENENLISQIQAKSDTPASTAFASSDYSDVVSELDQMNFDHSFGYSEFSIENDSAGSKHEAKQVELKKSLVPPQLFVTLLLYGAHIASTTDRPTADMMRVPLLSSDDRSAATSMLQSLFESANQVNRSHRTVSEAWRKPVDPSEVAYAYPRIVADLKSMFENPGTLNKHFIPHAL